MVQGNPQTAKTVYEFEAINSEGKVVPLSQYRGKVLLICNVACRCSFSKTNFEQFVQLHQKYKDQGFEILVFPSDQFGNKEPDTPEETKKFITERYGATFPIFSRIKVNGSEAHPLFVFLKNKLDGIFGWNSIKWNFSKFLVGRDGIPVKRYAPNDEPFSAEKEIQDEIAKRFPPISKAE